MPYKYLFGPVISRRLGISLGIDLLPFKTCTLDCVYCECGKTTNLTLKEKTYIPTSAVIKELDEFLKSQPKLDYITFSGSGEPTLCKNIDQIITYLKKHYPEYKIAVITNGTLLYKPSIRKSILKADLVIPSLDSATPTGFARINRPDKNLNLTKIIKGLIKFRNEFLNQIWLEVFIVPEINDNKIELEALEKAIIQIKPDKLQINYLDRPGTEPWVKTLSAKKLNTIIKFFHNLNVDIITKYKPKKITTAFSEDTLLSIMATISRRPSTLEDLTQIHQISSLNLKKYLKKLIKMKKIETVKKPRGVFYRII